MNLTLNLFLTEIALTVLALGFGYWVVKLRRIMQNQADKLVGLDDFFDRNAETIRQIKEQFYKEETLQISEKREIEEIRLIIKKMQEEICNTKIDYENFKDYTHLHNGIIEKELDSIIKNAENKKSLPKKKK